MASQESHDTMRVNGHDLPYTVTGEGETVVLVHGAVSDRRTWSRQQGKLARDGFRAIAFTQRYYGEENWETGWPPYRIRTHADDLAAFIEGLDLGKVHLVAWSSGAHIALTVARETPELVKSVLVYEPVVPSYVEDLETLQAIDDDAKAMIGPVIEPMMAGKQELAARRFVDGVVNRRGYFDSLPEKARKIVHDNARVLPLMFDDGETDMPITCAQMLQIEPPVMIARGERSRAFFSLIADRAMRCAGGNHHLIQPGADHMWPGEYPDEFIQVVVSFIRRL